jgi:hypothetical protein
VFFGTIFACIGGCCSSTLGGVIRLWLASLFSPHDARSCHRIRKTLQYANRNLQFYDGILRCREEENIEDVLTGCPDWENFRPFFCRILLTLSNLFNAEVAQNFGLLFSTFTLRHALILTKMVWATFWAILTQTHLVTLLRMYTAHRMKEKTKRLLPSRTEQREW